MNKEIEQRLLEIEQRLHEISEKLIETAKSALRVEYEFTSVERSIFLKIHARYISTNYDGYINEHTLVRLTEQAKKATRKYLAEAKTNPVLCDLIDPAPIHEGLKKLELMSKFNKKWTETVLRTGVPKYIETLRPPKGKPVNQKLNEYIWQMAGWYNEFFQKPSYGTNSVFTRLVGDCLTVMDDNYQNNPPYKSIKRVILESRKRYPNGLPPALG